MKRPKERIKKVFEKALENGGNVTKAMREAKYSENTINNPSNVTETKSWEMLLEQYLPDDLIAKKAREGLDAYTIKTSFTEPDQTIPDFSVRQRYVETALKMKGKITEKKDITSKGESIFNNLTDEQLDKIIESKTRKARTDNVA